MAGPALIPALIATTVASVGAGVAGTVMSIRQSNMQAEIAKRNAEAAQQQAAAEEDRLRRDRRRRMGTLFAQIGSQGGTFTGSALDVIADEAAEAELDALTVRAQGRFRAADFRNQAGVARLNAIGSGISGFGNTAGTLLTGLTSINQVRTSQARQEGLVAG